MDNLSLIDVNKPDKLKQALNELIAYKNAAMEIPVITAEKLGLGNVNNTSDVDKPLSEAQKNYIDVENNKNVKIASENKQELSTDLVFNTGYGLYFKSSNNSQQEVITVENSGVETLNLGSDCIPLRLMHTISDVNGTAVLRNPKVSINNGGVQVEETIAFSSELEDVNTRKVEKDVFSSAEYPNGVVTYVEGTSFSDNTTDAMSLNSITRSITGGHIIAQDLTPLKLASETSRGLMSKEDVTRLNQLLTRVAALEGKTSRYFYTYSNNPNAEDINEFVVAMGHESPFEGVAVVVDETYHIWHYYENVGWKDDGADTVNQSTNNSLGIVVGSEEEGKIYIESDGSMSLVGYDNLKGQATTAYDALPNLVTGRSGLSLIQNSATGAEISYGTVAADDVPVSGQDITKLTIKNGIITLSVGYGTGTAAAGANVLKISADGVKFNNESAATENYVDTAVTQAILDSWEASY